MKIQLKNIFSLLFVCFFISCAQEKKKAITSNAAPDSFEITLGPSFYMTADDFNDLFISATITKGVLKENMTVDLVKKSNPNEKVSATIYRIDDNYNQPMKMAKAGQEVTLNIKVNNDKKFRFSNNGDEYAMVSRGQTVQAISAKVASGKATITVDGKPWKYSYYKIYHYTKDYGITKNPANILIVFTKPNKNLKNTPEEVLQISLFKAPKGTKTFAKKEIDVSFNSDIFGQERAYSKTLNAEYEAKATVTKYNLNGDKAVISGNLTADGKAFLCPECPNVPIKVEFENLEVELYNN